MCTNGVWPGMAGTRRDCRATKRTRAADRTGSWFVAALLAINVLLLAGPAPVSAAPAVHLPPTSGAFDYQLGGAYDRLSDGSRIDIVVRDASAAPLPGAYNICYVNGFQTQPDDAERWLAQPHVLLHDESGELVVDPEWPDEYLLDPSTAEQRAGIMAMLAPVITGCATSGFDAIEIDNLDTWTRFEQIDRAGALALAKDFIDLAHAAGLAIAQKNAAEIAEVGHAQLGFDFAIAEECGVWSECAAYTDVYGDHVLQIEYPDSLEERRIDFPAICALDERAPLAILRDRNLVPPDHHDYIRQQC